LTLNYYGFAFALVLGSAFLIGRARVLVQEFANQKAPTAATAINLLVFLLSTAFWAFFFWYFMKYSSVEFMKLLQIMAQRRRDRTHIVITQYITDPNQRKNKAASLIDEASKEQDPILQRRLIAQLASLLPLDQEILQMLEDFMYQAVDIEVEEQAGKVLLEI